MEIQITTINLWKYWKKPHNLRDFTLIDIQLFDEMWGGTRLVLFNIGIIIRCYK